MKQKNKNIILCILISFIILEVGIIIGLLSPVGNPCDGSMDTKTIAIPCDRILNSTTGDIKFDCFSDEFKEKYGLEE